MYQAILTRRYLTSKVMPLLAALAVALCTAMVLIVWSVMTGFLGTLLSFGRTLMGDVLISWPVVGFSYYEELIERLEADPLVAAATPIVETPGLLGVPTGETITVQVIGVEPEGYDRVTGYADALWWKPIDRPLPKDDDWEDPRLWNPPESLHAREPRWQTEESRQLWKRRFQRLYDAGLSLTVTNRDFPEPTPAVAIGVEVGQLNARQPGGWYEPHFLQLGGDTVTLSVLPLSRAGVAIDVQARRFPVANQFRTGLYQADANTVLVPLSALQDMLDMGEAVRTGAITPSAGGPAAAPGFGVQRDDAGRESFRRPAEIGVDPARATAVLVRAKDGVDAKALRARAEDIYAEFADRRAGEVPNAGRMMIVTWDERPAVAQFVGAVKKETGLVLFIFGVVSLTAVFLVFSIFWAMVSEKTRDVGILRAVGAGRAGVAWLFLRYGLTLGVVGALVGGALAFLVVLNINPIHDWLGRALGLYVWDPRVYYFFEIPSRVDPVRAAIVTLAGALCAVVGALVPALKAARMDPVRALRFE